MKRIILISVGLLVAAAIATTAMAFGPGRGPGYGPCGRGDFGGPAGLDLTADQKAKFIELRANRFKEIEPLRDQMFTKRDELRKLWLEPNPDQVKIVAAQKAMNALRDQIQDKMTAFRLSALKVLTPEQQEKIRSFAGSRGFGPGRGHGAGPGMWGGAGCFGGGPGARGNW